MRNSRFVLPNTNQINIPVETADCLLSLQNGTAALVYLYILRLQGMVDDAKAIQELGLSRTEYEDAMSQLASVGLVRWEGQIALPADEPVSCTAEDISRELENGTAFRTLSSEVAASLGRVLSDDDMMKLFNIYDRLGIPPEVILIMITSCKEEIRHRYNDERLPTMRYIEKEAYIWERDGIMTLELAEEYLRRRDRLRDDFNRVCREMQITDRAVTQKIREMINGWLEMGFSPEAVVIAYEKTVENTGKLTWKYMDSILKSWNKKKLHTAQEIERYDGRRFTAEEAIPTRSGPTSHEMDRMREVLNKI